MEWDGVLRAVAPKGDARILDGLAATMPDIVAQAQLTTTLRKAHFIAQTGEESDGFKAVEEYASGRAYEGRKDLGNVKAGDGVLFKGRSLIQLTGRDNYRRAGKDLGYDLEGNPTLASTWPLAGLIPAWYWRKRKINAAADRDDLEAVTRLVNGGLNGLDVRRLFLARAKKALGHPIADPIVKGLQQALKDRGYVGVGYIDGIMGNDTVGAIAAFQSANSLPVTGTFDAETTAKLRDPETPCKPILPQRANATTRTLLDQGSQIMASAVKVQNIAKTGIGLGGVTAVVSGVSDQISAAQEKLAWVQTLFTGIPGWAYGLAVMGVALMLYEAGKAVKEARLHDERTGKTS